MSSGTSINQSTIIIHYLNQMCTFQSVGACWLVTSLCSCRGMKGESDEMDHDGKVGIVESGREGKGGRRWEGKEERNEWEGGNGWEGWRVGMGRKVGRGGKEEGMVEGAFWQIKIYDYSPGGTIMPINSWHPWSLTQRQTRDSQSVTLVKHIVRKCTLQVSVKWIVVYYCQ